MCNFYLQDLFKFSLILCTCVCYMIFLDSTKSSTYFPSPTGLLNGFDIGSTADEGTGLARVSDPPPLNIDADVKELYK
jgi:hypothetical protein